MTQVSQTFNTPWPGSGPGQTFTLPANLISPLIQVVAIGGNTTAYDINGPFPAPLRYGAQVTGSFDPALCPLTIVVGSQGNVWQNGITNPGFGGNGFSGGGGAGGNDFPASNAGIDGGGGSTAILTSASGAPAVLIEAAGSDSTFLINPFIAGSRVVWGGTGGGFASNSANAFTGAGAVIESGSGGASGGNGGAGYNAFGTETPGSGGIGFGIVGSGANGNNGTAGGPGAGVGTGGQPDPSGVTGKSFADTSNVQFVGIADATTTAQVVFTYRVADAPLAPTPVAPTLGQFVDGLNEAQTFSGVYNAPVADTGALEGVVLRLIHGVTTQYWDGHALVSSPVVITPTSGFGATNGGAFSVAIPAGFLSDGTTYTYSFATVESLAGIQGAFSAPVSFNSVLSPSVAITAPTEGGFVNSLTPTISWSDTIPSGAQIQYRIVVYPTATTPTSPPASADPLAVYDFTANSASTATIIPISALGSLLPLVSITQYTVFVMIESTGNVNSPWARVDFTVQLELLATPTLALLPTTHPPSGMPAPQLTMESRDNLLLPVSSDMEGIFTPSSTSNCTVSATTTAPLQGATSTAVKSTAGGTMTVGLGVIVAAQGDVFNGQCLVDSLSTNRVVTLIINWLNSGGGSISMQNLQSTTESGTTHLEGASSGAPAGTAAAALLISWASTSANEVHLVDAAALFLGSAATPWTEGVGELGGFVVTTAQSLSEFQADYVGDGSWVDVVTDEIPVSVDLVNLGTAATTYDVGAPFNVPLSYRVRNFVIKDSYTAGGVNFPQQKVVSDWSPVQQLLSGLASDHWWLVPPTEPDNCMQLHRLPASSSTSSNTSLSTPTLPSMPTGMVASFVADEQEQMGVFRPFGKDTAIVVHGDIWATEFDLNLLFENPQEYENFRAIRDLQEVVLVKSDMEGSIYWVTLGPDLNPGIIKSADRQVSPMRGLTIHCVPTDPFVPG